MERNTIKKETITIIGNLPMKTGTGAEDMLDFANMVFSMSSSDSVDFAALLPKAYAAERSNILFHHLVMENRKIRALIDLYPFTMKLASYGSIKAAYIGTVSVHPNTRHKGYMTELMARAEETAVAQGCDLMILDGNRHRYQHFGFERAGMNCQFYMEKRNVAHCCACIYDKAYMQAPIYSFEELDSDNPEMKKYIEELFALYQRRNVTARTIEDFFLCLQSYHAVTYAVFKENMLAGYINLSADEQEVYEFELIETAELPRVIFDLMEGLECTAFRVFVGIDETDKIANLEKMCGNCMLGMTHQIKILNYENVLEFLFRWKQTYSVLAEADYVVGIQKKKQPGAEQNSKNNTVNYSIKVTGQEVCVEKTAREADAVFDALEFVRVLTTSFGILEQQKGQMGKLKNAPIGWFPLPFDLPNADTF